MSQECYNLVSLLVTSQGYCHLMKGVRKMAKVSANRALE